MKAFVSAMAIVLMVLAAPTACPQKDTPAGSAGGDSAGNNQPDGKAKACEQPAQIKIQPVAYTEIKANGLTYSAAAYLMDGDCDVVDLDGPGDSMKITLAALDSVGRRVPPILDSSPEESPWSAFVNIIVPTSFDIHLVATGNITRAQAKDDGVVFIGCQLIPVKTDKEPLNLKVSDIGSGKGKVECHVKK